MSWCQICILQNSLWRGLRIYDCPKSRLISFLWVWLVWLIHSIIWLLTAFHYQVFIFFWLITHLFIPVTTRFMITYLPFCVHKNKVFFGYLFTSFYVFFYFVCVNDTIHQFLWLFELHLSCVITEFTWFHLWFLRRFLNQ